MQSSTKDNWIKYSYIQTLLYINLKFPKISLGNLDNINYSIFMGSMISFILCFCLEFKRLTQSSFEHLFGNRRVLLLRWIRKCEHVVMLLGGVYCSYIKYITPTVWKMFLQLKTVWRFSFSFLHPNQPVILSSICWIALFYLLLLGPKIIWLFQGVFADVHFDHNSAWSHL